MKRTCFLISFLSHKTGDIIWAKLNISFVRKNNIGKIEMSVSSGPGSVEIMRGSMDSVRYRQILERHVIPFADTFRYFLHDNAPPHKAAVTLQLLESSQVSVLTWPPYSPDCNPIENI